MTKIFGSEDYPFYFGASPEILRVAGELRHSMTSAEKQLWKHLRNKQLKGHRFRRQHPVSEFVVDFFCYDSMLAIELDGDFHEDPRQKERDSGRTDCLNRLGITLIRFRNDQVFKKIDDVLETIEKVLKKRNY